jgi:hypothetical protein
MIVFFYLTFFKKTHFYSFFFLPNSKTLYTIQAVIVLSSIEGERIFSKYYSKLWPTLKDQKNFEAHIYSKTKGQNSKNKK